MIARDKAFGCILAGLLLSGCAGRPITKSGARESLRNTLGLELKKNEMEIEDVSEVGKYAVVKARVTTALKYERVGNRWVLQEVRLGDRHWESVDLLRKALDQERTARARELLAKVAAALEKYRQANGRYPNAPTYEALIDMLSPQYLPEIIRLDPWSRPFIYQYLSPQSYRLLSAGPDGQSGTPDDIVVTSKG